MAIIGRDTFTERRPAMAAGSPVWQKGLTEAQIDDFVHTYQRTRDTLGHDASHEAAAWTLHHGSSNLAAYFLVCARVIAAAHYDDGGRGIAAFRTWDRELQDLGQVGGAHSAAVGLLRQPRSGVPGDRPGGAAPPAGVADRPAPHHRVSRAQGLLGARAGPLVFPPDAERRGVAVPRVPVEAQ